MILVLIPRFFASLDAGPFSEVKLLSLTRDQLMVEQKNDATLSPLFEAVVAGNKMNSVSWLFKEGLLMRKWTPLTSSVADDWSVVTQIVVPVPYQTTILNLAHDNPLAGHLGVIQRCDCVLCHFAD